MSNENDQFCFVGLVPKNIHQNAKKISNLDFKSYFCKRMEKSKKDIIAELKTELWLCSGHKAVCVRKESKSLSFLLSHFPENAFPQGVLHEFLYQQEEEKAASFAFTSVLISSLLNSNGIVVWITNRQLIFPASLCHFSLHPERIFFINALQQKEICWVLEKALQCEVLTAVIAEVNHLDFLLSRRLQLAAEQSKVSAFLLHHNSGKKVQNTCFSRWSVQPTHSVARDGLPGVGNPRWRVTLHKIRNGKSGQWQVEWADNQLINIAESFDAHLIQPVQSA